MASLNTSQVSGDISAGSQLRALYMEVKGPESLRVSLDLPQRLEVLTDYLFGCFDQQCSTLQGSAFKPPIGPSQSGSEFAPAMEPRAIDRWWLWVDFALRAFGEGGAFREHFQGSLDSRLPATCSYRLRFLEAASQFLYSLLECLNPIFEVPSSGVSGALLRDFAWLFGKYGDLEYDVPGELLVAQVLECLGQSKTVYPNAWHFPIGQFFHAVDVWLLGDLLLRTPFEKQTSGKLSLAEQVAAQIPTGSEEPTTGRQLQWTAKKVRANYFLTAIFHDLGRVHSYRSLLLKSVPILAQVLLPTEGPPGEELLEKAMELARNTHWGTDFEDHCRAQPGILSHYFLSQVLRWALREREKEEFGQALDAIGHHGRFESEIAYVSCPTATLFDLLEPLCISDDDDDDPLAKKAMLRTAEPGRQSPPLAWPVDGGEYSLGAILRSRSPVEQLEWPIFPFEPGLSANSWPQNTVAQTRVVFRVDESDRFCIPMNWLHAYRNWCRLDLEGCPLRPQVCFLSPFNHAQLVGAGLSRMEELRDYFVIHPRSVKPFWPDSSKAVTYEKTPLAEKFTIDINRLREDNIQPSDLNVDWTDFVAWSALRGREFLSFGA